MLNIIKNFVSKVFQKSGAGFTFVELLISMAIVTFIMSVVLYNYGVFNDNLALSSAGQEMVIAVRQAQTYGLNVKEVSVGGGHFSSAYGIYFYPSGEPTNYYIFADTNGNQRYDTGTGCGSGNTECIERLTLRNGVIMSGICDINNACPPPGGVRRMNATYLRPNPDADIRFKTNINAPSGGPQQTGKIILTSPKGKTLIVTIENSGQVSVQ